MAGSILVPLDGSKNAENALPWAASLARLYDTPVELVHVMEGEGDLPVVASTFTGYASELAAKFELPSHAARVLQGNPASAIVEAAADAKFTVIASHGHGGFRAAFVGSVADKVIRNTPVPLFLVPAIGAPAEPDSRTVLVSLDGSDAAERGLALARELAGKLKASITLVRAWTFPVQGGGAFEAYYPSQELFESIEAGAVEYIAATAQPGDGTVVAMGPAASVIADAAARLNPELVVVTTSGKGFAARIALGSTTERLAHSLHRPLLIVPVTD